MTKSFDILVHKLNTFQLKYYSYQLIKGLVVSAVVLIVLFTSFSLIEYVGYLSSDARKTVFYGFIVFAVLLLVSFVGIPLLRLVHILKPLNLKSTSQLIQNHFSGIQDKLLNIIELSEYKSADVSNDLLLASIDQKINELKVFDFNEAVSFKNIRLVAVYLFISAGIALGLLVINKNIFTESAHRIIHYNETFIKPAPFTFYLQNEELRAKKGDAFTIKVTAEGNEIPQIVYINIDGNNYLMKTGAEGEYEFEMASVINPVRFYFTDLKYKSDTYQLQLLPKPGINSFKTEVTPPAYTALKSQVFDNMGDLQVPNGTRVKWLFNGMDVDSLYIILDDSLRISAQKSDEGFVLERNFYKSSAYNVFIQNRVTEPELALSYSIEVIPDLYPEIDVVQMQDSTHITRFFYKGVIGDDYGFSSLRFHYNVDNADSSVVIPIVRNLTDQDFYFSYDFNDVPDKEGIISYYFSVSDNDAVNRYKTTTSKSFTFHFPNQQELQVFDKEQFETLEDMLNKSQKLANEIQQDLKNLQFKNMDTSVSDWEKSQMVNDIVQKQNQLEKLYDQVKQSNENLNNYLNSFDKPNTDILEKQKQIEELLDEVFTDELKKLMEEFNKLAEEFDSKKLNQLSKNMDMSFDDLQKQLDRNLEMLKKMKIEQKLQDVIDRIEEMAGEEEKMAEEILEEKNFEQAKEAVEEHEKALEDLQNQIKDALKMNEELAKPMMFDEFDEDFKNVDESIEKSKENLEQKNRKKSGSSMKETSEKMKNMAFGMQQMLDMNSQEQNMENMQNLRQILSNLIYISFSQEDILNGLSGVDAKDPQLVQLNLHQKRIKDQSNIVKDSLYALAMRTPQITSTINNELVSLEINLNKASSEMEEALFPQARGSQQFVITAANNLALLLNEVLEQMEKQQANAQPGDQQCENPGGNGSGMQDLKQSSESLKKQLENMIQQMKEGGSQGMNQQLGESLMQHEMMQQMIREMMNNGSVGSGARNTLQQIDKMLEENRKELMNKSINAQTIKRQNLITTRLLEAEKAEMEREFEEKRESESADEFYSNPVKFFEYKEKENYSIEYLNKNSHKLNNFYNSKYKQYLNNIKSNQ
ncbi:hypothetical protein D1614_08915 [Maribellus luteus]|uniref:DUF4175 family protein n=1 Tax=Maribellus luteus TaxID=2305463 RepID=A0A399T0T9_9BACT|nr:DUF4175 family protein [Maribellus luteus]RIJ48644.1 hypothetical protein D1614_08915 [Maribellus luteus]